MNLLYLFANFARIGLFAIGGGLATLPFIYELANRSDWLKSEAIGNMLAIAQTVPGAIGVNLAAYIGFVYTGPLGGYAAAIGLTLPSIIIISIVARMFEAFKENKIVKNTFIALRPAAAGLLSAAGLGVIAASVFYASAAAWYEYIKWKEVLILGVFLFLVMKFKKHPVIYIAAAGALGVILKL